MSDQPSPPEQTQPPPAPRALTPQPPTPPQQQQQQQQQTSVTNAGVESVLIGPDPIIDELRLRSLSDPFGAAPPVRLPAREIIRPDTAADAELLRTFVTSQRMRDLWNQIEALQEEVIQHVRADRTNTDAYQQDLLYASSLLLRTPANYDEARQIVFRVRGDLQRERRVLADVRRYRPWLIGYYLACFLITVLAIGFDPTFRNLMPDSLPILKLAWLPILFGVFGALFNGMMALNEHTSVRQDFDPIHTSWYVLNPIMGGLMGLVVFIFFVVTSSSFAPNLATDPSIAQSHAPLVIWLLAFVVGWQQNIAFQLLNRFLKTVVPASRQEQRRPPPPPGEPVPGTAQSSQGAQPPQPS